MTSTLVLVVVVVMVALLFDVLNGLHDAANSIATIVSTRVLSPRVAVLWAAFFNFVAMFVFPPRVADTVSKIVKITPNDPAFVHVVLAGLIGAIVWDLLTWWWALPTSSSHALIGGLAGAGLAQGGWAVLRLDKISKVIEFIPLAPIMGLVAGVVLMFAAIWTFRRWRPAQVDRLFRRIQLLSASLYSLGHGGNDAQKTMGIIVALLIAAGMLPPDTQLSLRHGSTAWIVLSCFTAMGIGTALGGWRIVKTMGMKITKLKPIGGVCAETSAAMTLFIATHAGIPVSTTHTITGAIVGVGTTINFSGVKWGVARRIVWAWLFTIPASAAISAPCYMLLRYLAQP